MLAGVSVIGNPMAGLLNLLFPVECPGCTAPTESNRQVCGPCLNRLDPANLGDWVAAVTSPGTLDGAWSAFWFDDRLQDLVHAFKYDRREAIGQQLGEAAAGQMPGDVVAGYDLLVPIPLHKARQQERGFNQAAVLAASLGRLWQRPVAADIAVRLRRTKSQTNLTTEERRRNVADSFTITTQGQGEHILLIDDVLTTGATTAECAAALEAAGYGGVGVFTIATPQIDW